MPPIFERPGDFIDGRFAAPAAADGELCCRNPGDLDEVVSVHPFARSQIDLAVAAARRAQPAFRKMPSPSRRELLFRYRDRLKARREEIAEAIAREVGKPLWEARGEADAMASKVDVMLGEGARFTDRQAVADVGEIRHRPLGVVAVLGPFNFPGHLPNGQIVPALALGNTVVHKPSDKAPSTAAIMARCFDEAGLPKGVFNLVQGGADSGHALSVHPDVDGIMFTGSTSVGAGIVADNAHRPRCLVALELGGKNASIVLDDCALELTARSIAFAGFATAGQRCTATSRVIATPKIIDPLCERLAQIAARLRVGYPLDAEVFMGPMISEQARDRLRAAQRAADLAGLVAIEPGGEHEVPGRRGHYVRPAVRRAPTADHEVAGYSDEELFGPDLCVIPADDLEHAVALANRSRYGLCAAVYTGDPARFEAAASELQVGLVHHNQSTAGASGRLPFGGVKDSGNHHPAGILAGLACSHPQAVRSGPAQDAPLPIWPGMAP